MPTQRRGLAGLVVVAASLWAAPVDLPQVYSNPELGFTIRYPETLRPIARDPKQFNAVDMGWELVLDFATSGQESTIPLRLIAKRQKSPTYPSTDLNALRAGCRSYRETTVGGRLAGVCVSCGRGACSWTLYIPGSPEFSIVSLDQATRSTSEPEDGVYPVRSMIESMRFERIGPR